MKPRPGLLLGFEEPRALERRCAQRAIRERRRRLAAPGYDNVEVRTGDGTQGWPKAAPFDEIIAAAGGPDIPEALRRQLAPGGRLLLEPRLERYIGVIYRPESERWSHYSTASLPMQFDGYVWFDETTAVSPLPGPEHEGPADKFPFGL